LAFAVHDAPHAVVQVGMHSVTVMVAGGGTFSHFSSQRRSQLCVQQRPQAPLCWYLSQLPPPQLSPQSATHKPMQSTGSAVVVVVVQLSVQVSVQELSHSVLDVAVQDVSHSL
jgi:hypothetical protein